MRLNGNGTSWFVILRAAEGTFDEATVRIDGQPKRAVILSEPVE